MTAPPQGPGARTTTQKWLASLVAAIPIVLVFMAGLAGLAVIAYFVLMSFLLSSWGSNK